MKDKMTAEEYLNTISCLENLDIDKYEQLCRQDAFDDFKHIYEELLDDYMKIVYTDNKQHCRDVWERKLNNLLGK